LGSYLGLLWAFIQPIIFISVIWFVFEIGFRSGVIFGDTPFFLWLICGMIPWFFFADAVSSGTRAIVSNNFLVKKVAFRLSILPLVSISSAFIIHLVLFILLLIAFLLYGKMPSIYWLQAPYFIACTVFLVLGISWLTSAFRVFIKDVGNFITVIIQIGFWATPIFWSRDLVPEKYEYIIEFNPMAYIINGYRDTFINHVWFWENGAVTFYFWGIVAIILVVGIIVFKRLRPHFGDVL
jgi:ABC-type polysaccharide/polyol phosphate export permease